MKRIPNLPFTIAFLIMAPSFAQFEPNYNEDKVPDFEVPDPLTTFEGNTIASVAEWERLRRPELLAYFEREVYGRIPGSLDSLAHHLVEEGPALNGTAWRKQIDITLWKDGRSLTFNLLLYAPAAKTKVPFFLGYNFFGNHTVSQDPDIIVPTAWTMNQEEFGIEDHRPTDRSRGVRRNRWDLDAIIDAGYGLATIYYGEVDPDKDDMTDGLHALFYQGNQSRPEADEWGSIAAWAFGLRKALDYLGMETLADASKVIVFGHSRLGKAALWAGATDPRFVGVISNDSGCGGAALSKRAFGETVARINASFPHWFCDNFKEFNGNESALAVDQHQLLALIAPRPLYVASAEEDLWADPRGEFLSAHYASPVYGLFGLQGIPLKEMPSVNAPVHNTVGYHIRTGGHDVTPYDWAQFIAWADAFVK